MKKILSLWIVLLLGGLTAENLIRDPEFDRNVTAECHADANPGVLKRHQFTEDLTWNKCLRLEVLKYYRKNKDAGESYYARILIGGVPKKHGFAVYPNTIYKFSLELKGDIPAKNISLNGTEWNGDDYWKDRKKLKLSGDIKIEPSGDWRIYNGTFQTGADARTAAIGLTVWGESKYKNLPPIGGFIMIDKVKVEKQSGLLDAAVQTRAPKMMYKVAPAGQDMDGFVDYRSGAGAHCKTSFRAECAEDELVLTIRCFDDDMSKVRKNITGDGGEVWKDDVVEVFFDPVKPDRVLTQLVVAAGGGRWMGLGNGEVKQYDQWRAEVTQGADHWDVVMRIPYRLMGWEKRPPAGTAIGFNIGRQRPETKELSSWSFAHGDFQDRNSFGKLLLGSGADWRKQAAAGLKAGTAAPLLLAKIDEWEKRMAPLEEAFAEYEILADDVAMDGLGKRVFAIVAVPPTQDPTVPVLPGGLSQIPRNFSVRAAVNEFKPLPLAVTNLTGETEEYRVFVGGLGAHGSESPGLTGEGGTLFPAGKIQLLRGIRVKDGEDGKNNRRIDPLVKMDVSGTITVPPRDSGLVWMIFDTSGVKPGTYRGYVRVIPLSENLTENDWAKLKFTGKYQDIPLELEVLPFELDKAPAVPFFMFQPPRNEEFFKTMIEYGIDVFPINPWRIKAEFADDGTLRSSDTESAEKQIADLKKWAAAYGVTDKIRISICYSAYLIFRDVYAKKRFKYGTPEWRRAWSGYVGVMRDLMAKSGIAPERYNVEVWDEPKVEDSEELLAACRVMHETAPRMNQMLVLASWTFPVSYLEQLVPFVRVWNFWRDRYLGNPEYRAFIEQLRKKNKELSFYACSTSMRLDLYRYYRCHAWFGLLHNLDMISMYHLIDAPRGNYGINSWRAVTRGGVLYLSNEKPVSSVRMECLRIGINDMKYMKKLAELLQQKPSHPAAPEARRFLDSASARLFENIHDQEYAERLREQAIGFILNLSK